jgi:pyruvate dehydrogenase E1 component alpha subunit
LTDKRRLLIVNGMTIPTLSILGKEAKSAIPAEELVRALEVMELTRHIDERMVTLQRQGLITFAMSSLGEEGCVVASAHALTPDDWLYPQYREDGVMFWRGLSAEEYVHHMFSNARDPNKGKQMPNHFGSRELNVVTVSSPLSTQIPHAAGAAYAMKLKDAKSVALVYFGEGATSEGDFHCGLNFAAVRKAPCIFFCRNNQYAISTPAHEQFASDGIAPKGIGYGMETYKVDGNDYFAVYEATQKARKYCLEGKGPVLIEAMTYRRGPHSTSDDPSGYRDDTEEKEWKKNCPIVRLRTYLVQQNLWNEKKQHELQARIKKEVDVAIEKAKQTDLPVLDTLFEDVYFELTPNLVEQKAELKRFFPEGPWRN